MKLLLSVVFCVGSLLINVASATVIRVGASQPTFEVKLASNPTTGYQWKVVRYNKTCVSMKDSRYLAPKRQMIGAGGQMIFTFQNLNGKGCSSTTILFTYARPWESKQGQLKKVIVQFS
jgi:inhibitor of cysteine peptidase